jgi:hypothetical protein
LFISKTPDLEKAELPFLLGKQEFVDRNPWSENRLDRNESEQTVCAYELLLLVPYFKMETNCSIKSCIHPGMWTTSLDLMDAYFHIPIAPPFRKCLRFVWDNTVYQFRTLLTEGCKFFLWRKNETQVCSVVFP